MQFKNIEGLVRYVIDSAYGLLIINYTNRAVRTLMISLFRSFFCKHSKNYMLNDIKRVAGTNSICFCNSFWEI